MSLRCPDLGLVAELPRDRAFVLGSDEGCDLPMKGEGICPWHCSVSFAPVALVVVDLKSASGTFLGHRRLSRATFDRDAELDLGDASRGQHCRVRLHIGHDASPRIDVLFNDRLIESAVMTQSSMLIGRSSVCDISVGARYISRQHLRVMMLKDVFVVSDLNSRHGTSVSGEQVFRSWLVPGDDIQIGSRRLRFESGLQPCEPPPQTWRIMSHEEIFDIDMPIMDIGRSPRAHISLAQHRSVSRRHARLFWCQDGGLIIADLGSTSGVKVNGQTVAYARLEDGALIELGPWRGFVVGEVR